MFGEHKSLCLLLSSSPPIKSNWKMQDALCTLIIYNIMNKVKHVTSAYEYDSTYFNLPPVFCGVICLLNLLNILECIALHSERE